MKNLLPIPLIFLVLSLNATNTTNLILNDTTEIVDAEVLYKVFKKNNYLYLNLSTTNKQTATSIIKKGLIVYFDVKGKQKKDVYIKYPYSSAQEKTVNKPYKFNEETSILDLKNIIERLPAEAEYAYYKEKQLFHKDLNFHNISIAYKVTGELFEFILKVPKNKITNNSKIDLTKLSIGVTSNPYKTFDKNKQQGQKKVGMKQGSGKGGDRMGQNNKQGMSKSEIVTIDFWFDANLK
jgi:hypothetical protein